MKLARFDNETPGGWGAEISEVSSKPGHRGNDAVIVLKSGALTTALRRKKGMFQIGTANFAFVIGMVVGGSVNTRQKTGKSAVS